MLAFILGLVLATSGLNDPGLQGRSPDGWTADRPAADLASVEPTAPAAADTAREQWDLRR